VKIEKKLVTALLFFLTRVAIAILIASFVSLPLTIVLFENSIKKELQVHYRKQAEDIETLLSNANTELANFSKEKDTDDCKTSRESIRKYKTKKESDQQDSINKKHRKIYGPNQSGLDADIIKEESFFKENCSSQRNRSAFEQKQFSEISKKIDDLNKRKYEILATKIDLFSGKYGLNLLEKKYSEQTQEALFSLSPTRSTFLVLFVLEILLVVIKVLASSSYSAKFSDLEDDRSK
jgi:Domain of unknown function (DUF4407)